MDVNVPFTEMEDLHNCCRVCLKEPHRQQMLDMNKIYDVESQLTYYDCYKVCTNHNLRECGNNEPNTICKHCGVELQWAYDFYKKVAKANKELKNMQIIVETDANGVDQEGKLIFKKDFKKLDEKMEENLTKLEPAAEQAASDPETPELTKTGLLARQRYFGKFSCRFCNKIFRNHSHMLKHQLIHRSDRPKFPCTSCDRVYLTKQALKVHVNTKHNNTGSACPICNKVFPIAKGLEIHMRFHNRYFPFECHQCERKFAQRSHLNIHQQVKHSRSRFLCEFPKCGKLFTSSSALSNHECTHTEMPFKCDVCQEGFPARYKLRLHAQRKHNMQLTLEQLESMRKCYITRSKRVLAKIVTQQTEGGKLNAK